MKKSSCIAGREIIAATLLILSGIDSCFAIHAQGSRNVQPGQASETIFTITGSAGYLNGEARELVYTSASYDRRKLSELIWDIDGIFMVGGIISLNINNTIDLNLGIWTGVTEGNGGMVDYDWYPETPNAPDANSWTDRSISKVELISAMVVDLNGSVEIFKIQDASFRAVAGIKFDFWEWDEKAYDYVYSLNSFRDISGSFNGENLIDYEQTFIIPYVGVKVTLPVGSIDIDPYLLYSFAVYAEDEDMHILRELHFKETFVGGDYIAAGIRATYHIVPELFISCSIDHQSIPEISGDMEYTGPDGITERESDIAGISHKSTMFSISLGGNF